MKLIKIISTSDQKTGLFNVDFRTQFIVQPQSKIAVVNASFPTKANSISVSSANNTFSYTRKSGGTVFNATIPPSDYTQTRFREALLQALSEVQTTATSGNLNGVNFQWNVPPLDERGLLRIEYARQPLINFNGSNSVDYDIRNTQAPGVAQGNWEAEAGVSPAGQYNHFAIATIPFSNGTGTFQIQFGDNSYGGKSNGIMGILSDRSETRSTLKASDFKYGIVANALDDYSVIENGIANDSSVAMNDNDLIILRLCSTNSAEAGKINFVVVRDGTSDEISLGTPSTVFDFNSGPYYPAFGIKSGTNTAYNVKFCPDAFYSTSLDDVVVDAPAPTKVTLNLTDGSMNLLGFDDKDSSLNQVAGTFTAVHPLVDTNTPPSLSVEIPSLTDIQSFDSVSGDRRPIVAACPLGSVLSKGNMVYNPPYPIFVDIANALPIPVTELTVRIVDSKNNEPVDLAGEGTSLTLAIAGPKEAIH